MANKDRYEHLALEYAEKFGIISYKVIGNKMRFNQNYHNKEFICGKWINNPCTYQRILNLDTMQIDTIKLKRLQKDGWNNV